MKQSTDKDGLNESVSALLADRKTLFAKVSIVKDGFLVLGKLILSIVTFSIFIFMSAMYDGSMGAARVVAIKMTDKASTTQIKDYRKVGYIIVIASVFYVLYALRLLFGEEPVKYKAFIAMIIIGYTVIEFVYLGWSLLKLRDSKELEMKALRFASFASTLLCFVLAQAAFVSLLHQTDSRISSAWTCIICGSLAVITGLFVIFDSYVIQKKRSFK